MVFVKKTSVDPEVSVSILKHPAHRFDDARRPDVILPAGLSATRKDYLYRSVRPYVRPQYQDITCPAPAAIEEWLCYLVDWADVRISHWLTIKPPNYKPNGISRAPSSQGGGVLWYYYAYVGSGNFLGFKILNFNIFWGFQKNEYFLGVWRFCGYFLGGITKLG